MKLETAETFRIRPESRNIEEVLIKAYRDVEVIKMGGSSFVVVGHDCVTFVLQAVKFAGPAAWTGEGLPPVGTVCEVVSPGYSNDRFDRFVGQVVTVVAHDVIDGTPVAVFRIPVGGQADEMDYHALVAKCFRPVRTPEQIAADERLHEIRNALTTINAKVHFPNDLVRGNILAAAVEAMIDAGYRKQVQP